MEAEASGQAPEGPARQLLNEQVALVRQQVLAQRIGNLLRLGTAALALVVAGLVGVMVWQASRADGLVIKSFSVPPELAQRGVTGEAVASQLLDKLSQVGERAWTSERQRRVSADRGDNIAIEIPQTGVSLSQLDQWLREKLGRQTRLTGEVMLQPDGRLTLAARIGSDVLPSQTGTPAELEAMLQRVAEAIYAHNQPRSYFDYLMRVGRLADAEPLARAAAADPDPDVRAWGFSAISWVQQATGDPVAALASLRRAQALSEKSPGLNNLAIAEWNAGHAETAIRLTRQLVARALADDSRDPEARRNNALLTEARLSTYVGDSARALQLAEELRRSKVLGYQAGRFVVFGPIIAGRAGLHELSVARRELADVGDHLVGRVALAARIALVAEDWPQVLELGRRALEESRDAAINTRLRCSFSALALVKLGRLPEAEAVLTETPLDSEPCVRVRAVAAEAAGDRRLADHWFGEAVRMAPSAPYAAAEWGRAKLARGDRLGAAALFAQAHRISPRYADATVWWGEALLAGDDATGAVDKFAQAAKLAPRWGRLHLKWGEALAKLGKVEEARAKWRAAATMDLTLAERAELQALTQKRTT